MSAEPDFDPAAIFRIEATELIAQIEATVLEITGAPETAGSEAINRLFRAFHTIKGSGSMCGFDAVARFTHHIENALDKVRDGTLPMSGPLLEIVLAATDQIHRLLEPGPGPAGAEDPAGTQIVDSLRALVAASPPSPEPACQATQPTGREPPPAPAAAGPAATSRVRFVPSAAMLARGFDLAALFRELHGFGRSAVAEPLASPANPGAPGWSITLVSDRILRSIKAGLASALPEADIQIAGIEADARPGSAPAASPTPPATRPMAQTVPASPGTARTAAESVVRVPSAKLDRLVNLVSEMVMNQSRLAQVASASEVMDLAAPVEALERLVAEMRDSVLSIRMMPIGSTFNRFKRLVHDLARELHKEIVLVTEGAETELDKTVLDQLGDPLVHLIRNCVDHGIEPPEARVRAGKSKCGVIRLAAAHVGGQVVVTIADDGRGLDVDRIRKKAVEKHLVAPEAVLSEQEVFKLILLPGFSTAETITNVSGRGVGMDVVRRQLDALRGDIRINSSPGHGTTVRLTLPLTLAIIDGLLIEIGPDQFIIPMAAVTENVELTALERQRNNGRNLLTVRGELVPYLRLREVFEIRGDEPAIEKVVIVSHAGERVGLVVDRVLGSHQTVIQPLGQFYRDIGVVSGSTIMGDGRVALIFDVAGLIAFTERQVRRIATPATPSPPPCVSAAAPALSSALRS